MKLPDLIVIPLCLPILGFFVNHVANCQKVKSNFKRENSDVKKDGLNPIGDATRSLTEAFLTNLVGGNDDNHFLSPLGITMLYSILLNYASGQTKDQLLKGLGMKDDPNFLQSLFKQANQLSRELNHFKKKDGMELGLNNILALQNSFKTEKGFEDWVKDTFKAEVITGDLHSQDFVDRINKIIAKKTKDKIENFLQGPLNGEIELLLINTIFFHGVWEKPFESDDTRQDEFENADGSTSQVQMMRLGKSELRYTETEDVQIAELPYTGGVSMIIVLPNDPKALKSNSHVKELLNAALQPMYSEDVVVQLPRFNVSNEYDLKQIFTQLGVERLFTSKADIHGISNGGSMHVSESKHRAMIEVNEIGSTAAAVSSIGVAFRSLSQPTVFKVNRPFMFLIRGSNPEIIYFAGTVTKL